MHFFECTSNGQPNAAATEENGSLSPVSGLSSRKDGRAPARRPGRRTLFAQHAEKAATDAQSSQIRDFLVEPTLSAETLPEIAEGESACTYTPITGYLGFKTLTFSESVFARPRPVSAIAYE